jgi:hypothetical protein
MPTLIGCKPQVPNKPIPVDAEIYRLILVMTILITVAQVIIVIEGSWLI